MDGLELKEIYTLLELLPVARELLVGDDDVPSRRQPTGELPRRAEATLPERVCPMSKQGQFPTGPAPEDL